MSGRQQAGALGPGCLLGPSSRLTQIPGLRSAAWQFTREACYYTKVFQSSWVEWVVEVAVACCMCMYLSFTTLPLYSLITQMHPDAKHKALARYIKRKHPDAMDLLGLDDPDAAAGSAGSSSGGSFSHYTAHNAHASVPEEDEEQAGEAGNGAAAPDQPALQPRTTLGGGQHRSFEQVRNIYVDFRHEASP